MSQLPIRIIFGKEIIRLAEEYGYYAVCADTKCCSFEDFGDIYPERQISIGIAEQNLIGVASGLASCGHKVVLATYSVFATMRACEQLRTYICHPKQDVIVMLRQQHVQRLVAGLDRGVVDIHRLFQLVQLLGRHPAAQRVYGCGTGGARKRR